ncbi:hypothetical protein QFZ23_002005 [Arthrobacter globiformis]|nr:hypothetical protein [Arthrobacter globiformis]
MTKTPLYLARNSPAPSSTTESSLSAFRNHSGVGAPGRAKAETCEPLKGSKRLLNLIEHFAVLCCSPEAGKESELRR